MGLQDVSYLRLLGQYSTRRYQRAAPETIWKWLNDTLIFADSSLRNRREGSIRPTVPWEARSEIATVVGAILRRDGYRGG
jgi:hypothetical protein